MNARIILDSILSLPIPSVHTEQIFKICYKYPNGHSIEIEFEKNGRDGFCEGWNLLSYVDVYE